MSKKSDLNLNESQSTAIHHDNGPMLVIAGAGTGKTRVITERIKHLIHDKDIKPQEILALTFTEKAAKEMVERIGDVMPLGYEEPWVYTFHSFADRLLRAEGLDIGLDPSYKIISDSEQWLMVRRNLFNFELSYFRPLGNPTKFISAMLKFISRLKDEDISVADFKKFVATYDPEDGEEEKRKYQELAHVYEKYEELKTKKSYLDFGDLIIWAMRLFRERPNVLKKYSRQFKHTFVDEFQDTNYAQYELIKMLFPKDDTETERSLLAVGDDSQSIYKFRGAAISNILQFMKDYPSAKRVTLNQNYRSSQTILDPSYAMIQNNNPDTLEAQLGISKKLISEIDAKGVKPEILQFEILEDEVEFVVQKIVELLGKEPQYTYKDFAILARANNHLEPFVMALRKYDLPYQLVGNRGLYDRDEVRDIVALLKLIVNPKDGVSLFRVLNIASLQIPYEEILRLLTDSRYKKIDLWEAVKESTDDKIIFLTKRIEEQQQHITKETPVTFVYNMVQGIKYLETYLQEETVENQLSIQNMDLFLNRVKKFEVDFRNETKQIPTIVDFIDYLEMVIEAGENPAQAEVEDIDTINLMTAHASKGLEFPVVFVVNMVSDRFPTRNRSDVIQIPDALVKETLPTGDEHIQEERRLFYVAITRAKKYLFMTLGKNYGGKREKIPSGFLLETGLDIKEVGKIEPSDQEPQTLFGIDSGFRDPSAQKIENFVPESLSYSQMESYETCPLKYKYSYILHIPTLPNSALTFGNTIHNTLKDYHTKLTFGTQMTLEELLESFEKNWQPLGYTEEAHRKARYEAGIKLLEQYYAENKNRTFSHLALEKPFNIRLDGVKFFGRIDRIDDLGNNEVEIVDYKTGNENGKKGQKEVDNDSQVTLYAIAAKEALGYEPKLLSLYFVETGQKFTTTRTPEQLEKKKKEVKEVIDKMRSGNFEPTPGMHCDWCDYNKICPAMKNS